MEEPILPRNPTNPGFWILRAFVFIISMAGNGLVVYLMLTRSRLNQVISNWFVLSLAVADLLVTMITLPEIVFRFENDYPWSLKTAYDSVLVVSTFNLCTLTLDRYIAVVHPLKYSYLICNTHLILLILATSWCVGLLAPWPSYICLCYKKFDAFRSLQLVALFVFELLPTIILLLAYSKLFLVVRRQENIVRIQNMQIRYNHGVASVQGTRLDKRNRSNNQVLGVILLVFVLCNTTSFYKGVKNYVLFEDVSMWPVSIARFLYQVNSAVNGYVYALLKSDIKQEVKKTLRISRLQRSSTI